MHHKSFVASSRRSRQQYLADLSTIGDVLPLSSGGGQLGPNIVGSPRYSVMEFQLYVVLPRRYVLRLKTYFYHDSFPSQVAND